MQEQDSLETINEYLEKALPCFDAYETLAENYDETDSPEGNPMKAFTAVAYADTIYLHKLCVSLIGSSFYKLCRTKFKRIHKRETGYLHRQQTSHQAPRDFRWCGR